MSDTRSYLDLSGLIRSGDTVMWGQSHAEPQTLIRLLVAQRAQLGRIRLFLGIGLSGILGPDHADAFDFLSYCGSGTNRILAEAGVLDILPVPYSRLPAIIARDKLRIDVLFLQVSPPDAQGRHSLGLAREYLRAAVDSARAIVGEVHPDVPWTHGGPYLYASDFAALVPSDAALPESSPRQIGAAEAAIGRNVATLVEDGATLQTGIGTIPDAALEALADRRDLGVHTGSFGEGLAALCRAGVVTNARKEIDTGTSIAGVLMGGAGLREFAHRNPALELRGTGYTHDAAVLGRLERFVSINSAIEVDLTGQVNSETVNGRYYGAVGGILDFARAAGTSRHGVPIIALPSTSRGTSRIVPSLTAPVSIPRSEACVIVTEHGIADLRDLTLAERVPRMIAIAHPDHREALARQARDSGLVHAAP